jgi:hypothetical protein
VSANTGMKAIGERCIRGGINATGYGHKNIKISEQVIETSIDVIET